MHVKKILNSLDFAVSKEEIRDLRSKTKSLVGSLKKEIRKQKFRADVFVGGSFAKDTLAKSGEYDIDIFIRFGETKEDLSKLLEKIVKRVETSYKKIHGSRDYFKIVDGEVVFELIPVLKISNVKKAQNVTDLSYFHVNYIKKNLPAHLRNDVAIAKLFFKAGGVYGAESYIKGFSGYGIECLILYYRGFKKMLGALAKVKGQIVLDPGKRYKKKADVLVELNESKTRGPLVLVDPTWKERNVLAALDWESFRKFQVKARKFLAKPSPKYFVLTGFELKKFKRKKGEFIHIVLNTERQEGDIAGTKMKKFSKYLVREIEKSFEVVDSDFVYPGIGGKADLYLILKSRGEIFRIGPPLAKKKHVAKFKKRNRVVFTRNGKLHARIKVKLTGKEFLRAFVKKRKKRIDEMGVSRIGITS